MQFNFKPVDMSHHTDNGNMAAFLERFKNSGTHMIASNPFYPNWASFHVEAYMMMVPVPPSYLSYEYETKEYQFLAPNPMVESIMLYMMGRFPLMNLEVIPSLNGKVFDDLDGHQKRRLQEQYVTAYIFPGIKRSNIFEYVNKILNTYNF